MATMVFSRILFVVLLGIVVSVLFLLSFQFAHAETPYDPFRSISNNPIIKMVGKYLDENSTLNTAFGTTIFATHVTCGGGDQTKINLGPVIKDVTSCNECEELATCAGEKKGVSNVGYLWDAHTEVCGLGIVVTEAEARSCEDKAVICEGVSLEELNKVKQDAIDMANNAAGFPFWSTYPVTPELLLAATYYMSGWDPLYGTDFYPGSMCPSSEFAFSGSTLCGNPELEAKTQAEHGTTCEMMPVSKKLPAEFCGGGRMGLAQIFPVDWQTWYTEIGWTINGSAVVINYPANPWNQREGFGAAATLLSIYLEETNGDEECALTRFILGSGASC